MEEKIYLGNQLEAQAHKAKALEEVKRMSEEEKYNLLEKAKKIPFEEVRKTMSINEYLMMNIVCEEAVKRVLSISLSESELNNLREKIFNKFKDGTMTMYEKGILDFIAREWGFEIPKKRK